MSEQAAEIEEPELPEHPPPVVVHTTLCSYFQQIPENTSVLELPTERASNMSLGKRLRSLWFIVVTDTTWLIRYLEQHEDFLEPEHKAILGVLNKYLYNIKIIKADQLEEDEDGFMARLFISWVMSILEEGTRLIQEFEQRLTKEKIESSLHPEDAGPVEASEGVSDAQEEVPTI